MRLKSPALHLFTQPFIRRRSKKTSKLRVTGLCVGNSPGTGEFPAQRASNAENVSIWWRHHLSPNSPRLVILFVDCATVNKVYLILSYFILSYLISKLRIHGECSTLWATGAKHFLSQVLEHCLWRYRYIVFDWLIEYLYFVISDKVHLIKTHAVKWM